MDDIWLTSDERKTIEEDIENNGSVEELIRIWKLHGMRMLNVKEIDKYFIYVTIYGTQQEKYEVIPYFRNPVVLAALYQSTNDRQLRRLFRQNDVDISSYITNERTGPKDYMMIKSIENFIYHPIVGYSLIFIVFQTIVLLISFLFPSINLANSLLLVYTGWSGFTFLNQKFTLLQRFGLPVSETTNDTLRQKTIIALIFLASGMFIPVIVLGLILFFVLKWIHALIEPDMVNKGLEQVVDGKIWIPEPGIWIMYAILVAIELVIVYLVYMFEQRRK